MMIKHIVCWTFREDAGNKRDNLQKAQEMLAGLKDRIPGIVRIEAGINNNAASEAYDLALYSEFEDQESLDNYQNHPEHQKVVEFMRKVREKRVVVDYVK